MPAPFQFKQFSIAHDQCAHKVGTDGVLLGAWVKAEQPQRILDVGTGSGLIALMLAQRFPQARIYGIDRDAPSAQQAQENALQSPFAERIRIMEGDFLHFPFEQKFDLIVSNPPFFIGNTSSGQISRDKARHEEYLPQTDFLRRSQALLSKSGELALILPRSEAQAFLEKAKTQRLYPCHILRIKGRAAAADKRWLIRLNQTAEDAQVEDLTLRKPDGSYSTEYRKLTADFHPNF